MLKINHNGKEFITANAPI